MDQNSLRLKVVRLAQRSRRAIRLYTSVHHNSAYTNYSSASSSSQESNLYASSALAANLKDTHHSIIDDFANSNCESHTLATASMAALSTKVSSSKSYRNSGEKFSEMQASEWREVNMSLLKALTAALEEPRQKDLPKRIILIRDAFGAEWRNLKMLLQANRSEAISAAERSDFIRLAALSECLVVLKARCQASEAAFHELSEVCKGIGFNSNSTTNVWEFKPSQPTHDTTLYGNNGSNLNNRQTLEQQPIFRATSSSVRGTEAARDLDSSPSNLRGFSRERLEQDEMDAQVSSEQVEGDLTMGKEHSNSLVTPEAPASDQKVIMLRVAYN